MSKDFLSMPVIKPEFVLLALGENIVYLSRYEQTSSFKKYDGSPKDELPEWKDEGPQLAITVTAGEEGKNGALTHRLQMYGFVRFDELSDKQIKTGKYENIGGYACVKTKAGATVRIIDEERTQKCTNILMQFCNALQIPVATEDDESTIGPGLDKAIAEKTLFKATVVNEQYEGKDQYRLSKFKAMANVMVTDDFGD